MGKERQTRKQEHSDDADDTFSPQCNGSQPTRDAGARSHAVDANAFQAPSTHNSTPQTPNFSPASLRGSLPNVSHWELWPTSSESSSHRP